MSTLACANREVLKDAIDSGLVTLPQLMQALEASGAVNIGA